MHRSTFFRTLALTALALAVAAGPAFARSASSNAPMAPASDAYSNWHEAVVASGLDLGSSIVLEPLTTEGGVTQYRLESLADSEIAYASVRIPVPGAGTSERPDSAAEEGSAGRGLIVRSAINVSDTSRCTVTIYRNAYFVLPLQELNVDMNSLGELDFQTTNYSQRDVNDEISSLATTCNAAYFFQHKNYGGTSLYVPANTGLATLGSLNDQISSLWHVIP